MTEHLSAGQSLKLSIVTPSFNHARFLEETILSIANQDYANVEHIIIDGGSSDGSVDVIKKHASKIAYWVSEPDKGHRYALKRGFDRATGDVVAWQNADDYYEPNVFKQVMRVFTERPDIDLVYGNVRLVDEHSREIGELRFVPTYYWTNLFQGFGLHNQAAFFRRSLWDAIGGITFDDYFFDYDLILRATKVAKMQFIHQFMGNYRAHAGSGFFGGQLAKPDAWVTRRRYLGRLAVLPTWCFWPLEKLSMCYRTIQFLRQGDLAWVMRGLRNQVRVGGTSRIE